MQSTSRLHLSVTQAQASEKQYVTVHVRCNTIAIHHQMQKISVLPKAKGLCIVKICSGLRRSPVNQPQNLLGKRLKYTEFVSQRHA